MNLKKTKSETKDPTCGMTVDKTTAIHAERDGKVYYFCGDHCRDKFLSTSPEDEDENEGLREAAQHGQQEHGTKEFVEDIRAGLRAKIRDVRSPQIRGSDS